MASASSAANSTPMLQAYPVAASCHGEQNPQLTRTLEYENHDQVMSGVYEGSDKPTDPVGCDTQQRRTKMEEQDTEDAHRIEEMEPLFLKRVDRIVFTLGVIDLPLSVLLACNPRFVGAYFYWYTVKLLTLIPLRFIIYKGLRYHYFLLDFCYMCNFLVLLLIWLPISEQDDVGTLEIYAALLYKISIMTTFGPLAVAIWSFRNGFTFHSLDKLTSCLIHFWPMVVIYIMKFSLQHHGNESDSVLIQTIPSTSSESKSLDFEAAYIQSLLVDNDKRLWNINVFTGKPFRFAIPATITMWDPWLLFALSVVFEFAYMLVTTVILPLPQDDFTYLTHFRMSYKDTKQREKIVSCLPESLRSTKYERLHQWIQRMKNTPVLLAEGLIGVIIFNEETGIVGLLYITAWCCWCASNGSTFYQDVFSTKYAEQVRARAGKKQITSMFY